MAPQCLHGWSGYLISFFQEVLVMKPCPFCGSDDIDYSYRQHPDGRELSFISCGGCGAGGPVRTYLCLDDDDESEAAWNKRPNAQAEGRRVFCGVPLERGVYAQHGHELMGCKSPVGEFNVDPVSDHND